MTKNLRLMQVILAVLWTAFIVFGLLSEPSGIPRFKWLTIEGVDKLIHAILFLVEAALLTLVFAKPRTLKIGLLILAWCVFLGGILELIQHYWVNGRSGDWVDLLADTLGAVIGFAIISRFKKK